jgi:hypothetical protein
MAGGFPLTRPQPMGSKNERAVPLETIEEAARLVAGPVALLQPSLTALLIGYLRIISHVGGC